MRTSQFLPAILSAGPTPGPYPPSPGPPLPAVPTPTSARGGQQAWMSAPCALGLQPPFPTTDPDAPYRGDFCGIDLPGAPPVYGGNTDVPSLIMSMLLPNYPIDWQHRILDAHAGRGYRDFHLSLWHFRYLYAGSGILSSVAKATIDARDHVGALLWPVRHEDRTVDGVRRTLGSSDLPVHAKSTFALRPMDLAGVSDAGDRNIDGLLTLCARVRAHGLRPHLFLTANDVRDGGRAYYEPELDAWLTALARERAIHRAGVGWQLDRSNSPRSLQEIIEYFYAKLDPAGILLDDHTINDSNSWPDDPDMPDDQKISSLPGDEHQGITTRFAWWALNRKYLKGGAMLQVDTRAPMNDVQDAIASVQRTTPVNCFEHSGQERFDGQMAEPYARLKGRIFAATPPPANGYDQTGYGNGGGEFSGAAL